MTGGLNGHAALEGVEANFLPLVCHRADARGWRVGRTEREQHRGAVGKGFAHDAEYHDAVGLCETGHGEHVGEDVLQAHCVALSVRGIDELVGQAPYHAVVGREFHLSQTQRRAHIGFWVIGDGAQVVAAVVGEHEFRVQRVDVCLCVEAEHEVVADLHQLATNLPHVHHVVGNILPHWVEKLRIVHKDASRAVVEPPLCTGGRGPIDEDVVSLLWCELIEFAGCGFEQVANALYLLIRPHVEIDVGGLGFIEEASQLPVVEADVEMVLAQAEMAQSDRQVERHGVEHLWLTVVHFDINACAAAVFLVAEEIAGTGQYGPEADAVGGSGEAVGDIAGLHIPGNFSIVAFCDPDAIDEDAPVASHIVVGVVEVEAEHIAAVGQHRHGDALPGKLTAGVEGRGGLSPSLSAVHRGFEVPAPRAVNQTVDARMNDLEGKSRSVDGIEELQTGWFAVGLAGTNLHGLAALGDAEDGIADDACVVEAPAPSVDGERVVGEVVLDGVLKTKVMDDFGGAGSCRSQPGLDIFGPCRAEAMRLLR